MNYFGRLFACVALFGAGLGAGASPEILREGTGERRENLDRMELVEFDHSLWGKLTDWSGGDPLNAVNTEGKVVLIYTWTGFLPTAVRPMSIVSRLVDRFGAYGLLVVGVHGDEGWDDAEAVAKQRRANFPIARDTGGAFREALLVDQDPDFYVIDRAGRMRFADIETASVERAVTMLIEESAEDSRTLLSRRADAAARAAEEARRTQRLRSQINLADLPWVSFTPPGEEAYNSAAWPKKKEDENSRRMSSRNQPSGPVKINLDRELDWRPSFPTQTDGRAVLIYLFHPDIITDASRGGYSAVRLFQSMDQIQAAHARDLLVIGAMIPDQIDPRASRRQDQADATRKAEEAVQKFDVIANELPVNHVRVNDYGQRIVTSQLTPDNGSQDRGGGRNAGFWLPYYILVSSDGIVRWHGNTAITRERSAEWEAALAAVLRGDPGVAARRAAEEAYIRALTE